MTWWPDSCTQAKRNTLTTVAHSARPGQAWCTMAQSGHPHMHIDSTSTRRSAARLRALRNKSAPQANTGSANPETNRSTSARCLEALTATSSRAERAMAHRTFAAGSSISCAHTDRRNPRGGPKTSPEVPARPSKSGFQGSCSESFGAQEASNITQKRRNNACISCSHVVLIACFVFSEWTARAVNDETTRAHRCPSTRSGTRTTRAKRP